MMSTCEIMQFFLLFCNFFFKFKNRFFFLSFLSILEQPIHVQNQNQKQIIKNCNKMHTHSFARTNTYTCPHSPIHNTNILYTKYIDSDSYGSSSNSYSSTSAHHRKTHSSYQGQYSASRHVSTTTN